MRILKYLKDKGIQWLEEIEVVWVLKLLVIVIIKNIEYSKYLLMKDLSINQVLIDKKGRLSYDLTKMFSNEDANSSLEQDELFFSYETNTQLKIGTTEPSQEYYQNTCVWSLGAIVYRLLFGRCPGFSEQNSAS